MGEFNRDRAIEGIGISRLPIAYELALIAGKTPADAYQSIASSLPKGQKLSVLRHGTSTAVVVYDTPTNAIHVAFDASDEFSDKLDDGTFWRKDHALGGHVHTGFWNAATRENTSGIVLVDAVRDTIKNYASQSKTPVDMHLSGFSKGGSAALIVAGQWMAERFPQPEDNVTLKSVYTLGSPPAGTTAFIKAFEESAKRGGVDAWRVVATDDFVPKVLGPDAPFYMPSYYAHLSNTVTLDGGSHDPDIYEGLVRKMDTEPKEKPSLARQLSNPALQPTPEPVVP